MSGGIPQGNWKNSKMEQLMKISTPNSRNLSIALGDIYLLEL